MDFSREATKTNFMEDVRDSFFSRRKKTLLINAYNITLNTIVTAIDDKMFNHKATIRI